MSDDHPASDPLGPKAVRHIAKLSRLSLADEEIDRYRAQLVAILGHISKLDAIDVTDIEPMAHPLPLVNRLGEDIEAPPMPIEGLLRNAPAVEGRYLAVPKVLADAGGA
jgi:aspartyl-tRNA(Asn)/glutamyl-tRNA(Gln) amidotransferase subunit C